jgi:HK97 family phage major capsid protein
MYWLGEAGTKLPTHPEFRQVELKLKKIAGLFYMTDELMQDATALSGVATDGFAEALDVQLEQSFIRGTGVGQPLGILNSGSLITVNGEVGQLPATILAENIVNMWARLWSRSMPNAVWFISQSILPQLMVLQFPGLVGIPMWMPPQGLAASPYGTLLGRPIFAIENCSTLGTVGDIILADMSQYLVIDKGGVQSASSIHVRFVNDETAYRVVYRVDGQPLWNATLAPRDGSAAVSPFVTLAN